MEKVRVTWIDSAKAFAIILVVLGHVAVYFTKSTHDIFGILAYYIYCFHMPLFFMLSGLSYKISQQSTKIKNKITYIALHCFDFGWAVLVFNLIADLPLMLSGDYEQIHLIDLVLKWASRYWYLAVLCLIYMIIPWAKRISILLLLALLMSSFLCGIVHMWVAKFILYLFYFALGMYLYELNISRCGVWYGVFFLIASTVWYFLSDGALLSDVYSKTVLGLSASLFILFVFKSQAQTGSPSPISRIGENTLIIYLTHGWIISWRGWGYIVESVPSVIIIFLMMLLAICIFMGIFIMLLTRIPLMKSILLKPSGFVKAYLTVNNMAK